MKNAVKIAFVLSLIGTGATPAYSDTNNVNAKTQSVSSDKSPSTSANSSTSGFKRQMPLSLRKATLADREKFETYEPSNLQGFNVFETEADESVIVYFGFPEDRDSLERSRNEKVMRQYKRGALPEGRYTKPFDQVAAAGLKIKF